MATKSKQGLNKFLKVGVPFFVFLFGGLYPLSTFLQTKNEIKDKRVKRVSERKFNLEEEHAKLMKQLDIDNFKLSRIPRPGEEDKKKQTNSQTKT